MLRSCWKASVLAVGMLLLAVGCSGGTQNISVHESAALLGSLEVERELSKRRSITGRYLVTGGSELQDEGIIQIDGERFDANGAKSEFRLNVLSLHYDFDLYNGRYVRFTGGAGIETDHLWVGTRLSNTKRSQSELTLCAGLKTVLEIKFGSRFSVEQYLTASTLGSNEPLITLGMSYNYKPDTKRMFRLGLHAVNRGDNPIGGFNGPGDGCTTLDQPADSNCEDSALDISAVGLHVGFVYRL